MDNKIAQCLKVGEIGTNCWIYPIELTSKPHTPSAGISSSMTIDPCAVIDPGDEASFIIDHLQKLNLFPKYILLTHGHFDHLGALPLLVNAFAPVIAIHRDDSLYLGPKAIIAHKADLMAVMGGDFFGTNFRSLPEPGILLSDGDEIGPFKVIHLPGHTAGSVAFYDEKAAILFSGDTLFYGNCGRTDLPGGDSRKLKNSLKRLLSMDGSIKVLPGHGPVTSIGQEAERGIGGF